jgi:Domain of Unknown Function (DUF1080)
VRRLSVIARIIPVVAALAALAFAGTLASPQAQPPDGFTALFNGRDLSGWYGLEHFDPRTLRAMSDDERAARRRANEESFRAHWRVEHGELVNDGQGPFATTERDYGDIELLVEYRTVARADSGIYLRGNPQVQIWDSTKEGGKWAQGADKGSGGLWNNSPGAPGKDPLERADKPFGEWNALRILQVGDKTTVHLNGALVVDHATMENFWDRKEPLWARGPIQLQTHGGEIRWRGAVGGGHAEEIMQTTSACLSAVITPSFACLAWPTVWCTRYTAQPKDFQTRSASVCRRSSGARRCRCRQTSLKDLQGPRRPSTADSSA